MLFGAKFNIKVYIMYKYFYIYYLRISYCRFFQELPITKSPTKVKGFNQIAARTRLAETSDYSKAFKDLDNKMIEVDLFPRIVFFNLPT